VAPSIMKAVLAKLLAQNDVIQQATSPYLDDIFVNEGVASAHRVENHLSRFGLVCKPAEQLVSGARVLGLDVWGSREGSCGNVAMLWVKSLHC